MADAADDPYWGMLAPLRAPVDASSPLSTNVEDRRDPAMLLSILNQLKPIPTVYDESNPLMEQLKQAIARGRIPGAR